MVTSHYLRPSSHSSYSKQFSEDGFKITTILNIDCCPSLPCILTVLFPPACSAFAVGCSVLALELWITFPSAGIYAAWLLNKEPPKMWLKALKKSALKPPQLVQTVAPKPAVQMEPPGRAPHMLRRKYKADAIHELRPRTTHFHKFY
uniref:Uncharacterized protein n=1 Tax=Glossina palpalis gambiensis TaxID=67801 RepID=A0A1B0C391_9MUSC